MSELKLYYLPSCPFCHKVLFFMEQHGINIDLYSTYEPANREYLIKHGGKNQVPCLFIDGKPMYESDDIIAYLRKQFL